MKFCKQSAHMHSSILLKQEQSMPSYAKTEIGSEIFWINVKTNTQYVL